MLIAGGCDPVLCNRQKGKNSPALRIKKILCFAF
jgi:hypothetical protein